MSKYRNTKDARFSEMFKALSNENRLSIFRRLAECCAPGRSVCKSKGICRCVGDVGKDLNIAPSTVSHHIKELNKAGLISLRRRGQFVECWIEPETLKEMSSYFSEMNKGVS